MVGSARSGLAGLCGDEKECTLNIDGDTTVWIERLKQREPQAIWERYSTALLKMARRKLEGMPRRAADEEDVALSAMNRFFQGVNAGRFAKLDDAHDLWKILVTIAARKAAAQRRKHL